MASNIDNQSDNSQDYDIITDFDNLNLIFQHHLQSLCLSLADRHNLNQKELLEDFLSSYHFTFENLNEHHSKHFKLRKKKNINPNNYCLARRLDHKQCTRLKKNNSDHCVSHQYRRPYGTISDELPVKKLCGKKKVSVIKHQHQGQEYYLDAYDNLYVEDDTLNLRLYGIWDAYKGKIDIPKYWANKNKNRSKSKSKSNTLTRKENVQGNKKEKSKNENQS